MCWTNGSSRKSYHVFEAVHSSSVGRAVGNIDEWCHDNRHLPIEEQHKKLNEKLRGHYAYYGVTGNSGSLTRFLHEVGPRWRKWLNRRNRIRSMYGNLNNGRYSRHIESGRRKGQTFQRVLSIHKSSIGRGRIDPSTLFGGVTE